MDHKTGEIIETKDVTFAERVPNLRGIVHSMPGPNAQHWFQPEVLDPNDSVSQMVSSPPTVDSESVADTDNSAPTDNDEDSIDASEPQSDSIVITQENLDDYLDEELRLPERRTPKPRVHFEFPDDHIPYANRQGRRHRAKSVRMIRQAARGSAYRTKYKEAIKDPDTAASMRKELADLLIPQGDRGSKVTIERLPVGVKALGNTWASKKSSTQRALTFARSRGSVLMASMRSPTFTLILMELKRLR